MHAAAATYRPETPASLSSLFFAQTIPKAPVGASEGIWVGAGGGGAGGCADSKGVWALLSIM